VQKRKRLVSERISNSLLLGIVLGLLALEGSLDYVDEGAKSAEQGAKAEAPALDTDGIDEEVDLEEEMC